MAGNFVKICAGKQFAHTHLCLLLLWDKFEEGPGGGGAAEQAGTRLPTYIGPPTGPPHPPVRTCIGLVGPGGTKDPKTRISF